MIQGAAICSCDLTCLQKAGNLQHFNSKQTSKLVWTVFVIIVILVLKLNLDLIPKNVPNIAFYHLQLEAPVAEDFLNNSKDK